MNLYDETIALLRRSPITQKAIAADMGVSPQYIRNLLHRPDIDPKARTLQRLHDYLADIEKARARHVA